MYFLHFHGYLLLLKNSTNQFSRYLMGILEVVNGICTCWNKRYAIMEVRITFLCDSTVTWQFTIHSSKSNSTFMTSVEIVNGTQEESSLSRTHQKPACLQESPQWYIFPPFLRDQNTWLLPTSGNTGGESQCLANPFSVNNALLNYNTLDGDQMFGNPIDCFGDLQILTQDWSIFHRL